MGYSKQFCDKRSMGLEGDFDILEIADLLPNEHYTLQVCDGYGFVSISKDEYGGIHLGFINDENNIYWIDYNEVVK